MADAGHADYDAPADTADLDGFLARWEASGGAERANCQLFLSELRTQVQAPIPDPTGPDEDDNAYGFEKSVTFRNPDGSTSTGRIDLYKRGCFVLEAKQGSDRVEPGGNPLKLPSKPPRKKGTAVRGTAVRGTAGWDQAMVAARGQADKYVRALPASEPNPVFLVAVDVGHMPGGRCSLVGTTGVRTACEPQLPRRQAPASLLDARTSRSTRSSGIGLRGENVMPVLVALRPVAAISSACSEMAPGRRYRPHCLLNAA